MIRDRSALSSSRFLALGVSQPAANFGLWTLEMPIRDNTARRQRTFWWHLILPAPFQGLYALWIRRILSTKLKVSLATFDSVIGLFCFSMMGLFGLVTNAGFGAIRSNGLGYLQMFATIRELQVFAASWCRGSFC